MPVVSAGLAALLQRSPRKHPGRGAGHLSAPPGGRGPGPALAAVSQRGAVDTDEDAAPSWSCHRRQQLWQRGEGARPPRLGKLRPRRSRSAGPVSGVWCPSGRRGPLSTCTLPQRGSLLRVCPALAFRSAAPGFLSQALSVHLRFYSWWEKQGSPVYYRARELGQSCRSRL